MIPTRTIPDEWRAPPAQSSRADPPGRDASGDTLLGLKPGSFSGLLPSHMPGVPRTTWLLPGYLHGLGPLPTALGTLQPAARRVAPSHTEYVCDSSNSSIMVDVLRGDLLPTTANIRLPKDQLYCTEKQDSLERCCEESTSCCERPTSCGATLRVPAVKTAGETRLTTGAEAPMLSAGSTW